MHKSAGETLKFHSPWVDCEFSPCQILLPVVQLRTLRSSTTYSIRAVLVHYIRTDARLASQVHVVSSWLPDLFAKRKITPFDIRNILQRLQCRLSSTNRPGLSGLGPAEGLWRSQDFAEASVVQQGLLLWYTAPGRCLGPRGPIMKCPHCGSSDSRVVDTRTTGDGIRRRRECSACEKRFTTYEQVAASLIIVKENGRREPYDRQKLMHGILIACAKRPISQTAIEGMVDGIEEELAAIGRTEVKSKVVGGMVLERLRQLDPMAYVRFAMVYLDLKDLQALQDHIGRLLVTR